MSKHWILSGAAGVALLLAAGCGGDEKPAPPVEPPTVTATATETPAAKPAATSLPMKTVDADGLRAVIADQKGKKIVVLNVWATYCAPCVAEFPHFAELGREAKDVEVIFLSGDFQEDLEKAQEFLTKQGVTWQSYLIADVSDQAFFAAVSPEWTGGMPATRVFATDGTEITFHDGEMDRQTLNDYVAKARAHGAEAK